MSAEDFQDLEAAMGLIRGLIDSHSLSPAVLASRLGWPEGKVEEWLEKPYEARIADYLRLLRRLGSRIVKGAEGAGSDLLGGTFELEAESRDVEPDEANIAFEGDEPQLRLLDLHFTMILALIADGRLSGREVIDLMRRHERQIRKLGEGH